MPWLTVAVQASFPWTTKPVEVTYGGDKFFLNPETDELSQSVSMEYANSADIESARLKTNRFLSALSWTEQGGVRDLFAIGSGSPVPPRVGKSNVRSVAAHFKIDYLPEPKDDRSRRALALYREAAGVNSPAYSFLGFFKIINVLFPNRDAQVAWIDSNQIHVTEVRAKSCMMELLKAQSSIGEYLYTQGRCAIAHAFDEPVVDPDEPEDMSRLSKDIPLIKDFARIAIERELGLQSSRAFYEAHLYELKGFVSILGDTVVGLLREGKPLPADAKFSIPHLSICLRDQANFEAYEHLESVAVQQDGGILAIHLHSPDHLLQVVILLDFQQWRLRFDPFQNVNIADDGTLRSYEIENQTLLLARGLYLNGELEVYDSENGTLLARTDPFIPVNVDLSATISNLDKSAAQALATARERAKAKPDA